MKKSEIELEKAKSKIYEKYTKITPTGKTSVTHARNLYFFLLLAFADGLEKEKTYTSISGFKKLTKELKGLGYDEEYIEKWHKIYQEENPKREIEVINVVLDFSKQTPDDYVAPKSSYSNMFEEFLKPKLKVIK